MVRSVRFRNSTGQAFVEFALILMVLTFIIFGITELGRALYTYNTVIQTTREAARWAVVNVADNGDTADINRTKNVVVYGNPDVAAGYPRLPGLTAAMVNVAVQPMETDVNGVPINQKVSVSVQNYQFQFLVGFLPTLTMPAYETSLYTESMGFIPP